MKRCEAIIRFARLREVGIYVRLSLCLFLILLFLGCAAPQPLIIKNHPEEPPPRKSFFSSIWPTKHKQEEPPQKSTAALHQEDQKKAVSNDMADLLNLLKSKNVISADDANQLAKKYGITLPAVKNDNPAASKSDNGRVEKAAANKTDESGESNQEQITNSTKKESSEELKKSDKEQKEETPANIDEEKKDEEMKKDVSGSAANDEQKDVSLEDTKSGKGQNEKAPASPDEETKKDISASAVNDEQKDVPQEAVKNDKGQNEKTPASPDEEMKKDVSASAGNEAQNNVPQDAVKNDKKQSENIPVSISEDLKKEIEEQVRIQIQKEVPNEIKELNLASVVPEWIKNIRFGGDFRLRYEGDRFDKNNGYYFIPSNPTQLMNTTTDHDYFRYRVRVGVEVPINDQMDAIIRLGTGNTTVPVSTTLTMGNFMERDTGYFDLAYIRWHPWNFLTFEGGRMPNPWFSSDLLWSPSLNFEGFALTMNKSVTETLTPFLTVGVFPLEQDSLTSNSKYLTAGQLGLERKKEKGISWKIGAAYYNFSNITGEVNNPSNPDLMDWSAPLYMQKGNTIFNIETTGSTNAYLFALASQFREFNVTANFDIGFWNPVHIVFLGDYVRNLGFNLSDVEQRTGLPNAGDIDGYQVGVAVGYPEVKEFGQWKTYLYYKYLGADAVVDAFTDYDFHLGGTDAKGWIFGADLGLAKNLWLTARWMTADEIHGNQLSQSGFGGPLAIDVIQLDLNARF
ncbi:MAG: putative porin [Smithella sp.]